MKKKMLSLLLAGCCLLTGCSSAAVVGSAPASPEALQSAPVLPSENAPENTLPEASVPALEDAYIDSVSLGDGVDLEEELVPLATMPILVNVAAGAAVKSGGGAEIDYSNVNDGFVMVRFAGVSDTRLRVQVTGPSTTYTYDLTTGGWVTYPLSDGNGSYKVTALKNTTGKKYATLTSVSFQVSLTDEFAPFIRPNQYVNYEGAVNTIAKAEELAGKISDPLKKVEAVYEFVVKNLTYDRQLAKTVQSGYLPVLDSVLAGRKGICFDYAALMTGMLRSQGVPCKLVVGYAGTQYHAWVSVWTEATGWVDGVIFFDGTTWQRMDPTFASSGNTQYTLNSNNYSVKYLY